MKKTLLLTLICIATTIATCPLSAQTSVPVNVSNTQFTPANISINQGDTVVWTNTAGFHNVNGTTGTYAANPEGFGRTVGGAPWTFTHVFNITGMYNYRCDPHFGQGMTGTINVQSTTGIDNTSPTITKINAYPSPATEQINVDLSEFSNLKNQNFNLYLIDLQGRSLLKSAVSSGVNVIELNGISNGQYILRLENTDRIIGQTDIVVKKQ
ncbi:MAG: T9SS type A sorting domain-containing protein [Bacteroidia bacterium]|nr:T9SS type A sorting domain-containing protein [Bacteroidia bacterium]